MTSKVPDLFHDEPAFVLRSGRSMPARLAYVTLGTLNDERSNAILVTHGYTSSHRFILDDDPAFETSWSGLVGPGCAIDTDKFFVISSNALGSSYGSTSPASTDPSTGKPYGSLFPTIDFADIVALQRRLLDALEVKRLHSIVGVSMGGYQALQWGVQYPEDMSKLVVALSSFSSSPGSLASMRKTFAADASWNAGFPLPGALAPLLARMRTETLHRYGLKAWLDDQDMPESDREQILARQSRAWAEVHDPLSMLVLREAIEAYDVRARLAEIKAKMMLVLSSTDCVFPSSAGPKMLHQLRSNGVDASYHELVSRYGHLASGLDWNRWACQLRDFLTS